MNGSDQETILLTTETSQFSISPGEKLEIPVNVTNQGRTQEQLRISVEGIPMVWVSTEHPVVLLQPYEQFFGSAAKVTQAMLQGLKDGTLGFIQTRPGRPGPQTRYRRQQRHHWRLTWQIDEAKIALRKAGATEEERLLGVSLTGIMDHSVLNGSQGTEVLEAWLEHVRDL